MKKEIDFSRGKRGAVLPTAGKTRITIYLDDVILDRFKYFRRPSQIGQNRKFSPMKCSPQS
jgi:hypothetical protein